jgi:hypothetical protein
MSVQINSELVLLPTLQPGQIVIMDNATFHKGGRISQLIEGRGRQLLYLYWTYGDTLYVVWTQLRSHPA